ncbi:MAG: hypothetical protein QXM34_02235 [Zestosphaera sp.]
MRVIKLFSNNSLKLRKTGTLSLEHRVASLPLLKASHFRAGRRSV